MGYTGILKAYSNVRRQINRKREVRKMKKIIAMTLCALLALGMAACGEAGPADTKTPEESSAAVETAAPAPAETVPGESTDEGTGNESLLETAKQFEGKPVEELIAAVGEPESSDYAPSCLGDGEDGNLYYDGFTVYTYKDDSGEIVNYVE